MGRRFVPLIGIAFSLCAAISWLPGTVRAEQAPATATNAAVKDTLVVGVISGDPKNRMPKLEALAKYLAARLGDLGIRHGRGIVASNNAAMIEMLRSGAVDLVSETVLSGTLLVRETGAEFLLREWKKGAAEYQTVFVTRRDSGIASLDDLGGRMLAFEDPGSTTGFLLPLALLRAHGFELEEVPLGTAAPPGRVGYAFAKGEINIAAWVVRGVADAGAMNDQDWDDLGRTPKPLKDELVIFHRSEPILRSTIIASPTLGAPLKAAVKSLLLAMHKESEGQEVLEAYNKVAKYDEIAGEARRALERAQELYPRIADLLR